MNNFKKFVTALSVIATLGVFVPTVSAARPFFKFMSVQKAPKDLVKIKLVSLSQQYKAAKADCAGAAKCAAADKLQADINTLLAGSNLTAEQKNTLLASAQNDTSVAAITNNITNASSMIYLIMSNNASNATDPGNIINTVIKTVIVQIVSIPATSNVTVTIPQSGYTA